MSILGKIKAWLAPKWKPGEHGLRLDAEMTELTGEQVYVFDPPSQMPAARFFEQLALLRELDLTVTREEALAALKALASTQEAALELKVGSDGSSSINLEAILDARRQAGMLIDRLQWVVEPETLLRASTAMFVVDGEDPASFDHGLNLGPNGKLERWKKKVGVVRLLCSRPLIELAGWQDLQLSTFLNSLSKSASAKVEWMDGLLASPTLKQPEREALSKSRELLSATLNALTAYAGWVGGDTTSGSELLQQLPPNSASAKLTA